MSVKSVTQADIARALGISQPTVGLVMGRSSGRGKEKLRPETVERILRKAEEMGYRPHRGAQMMRQNKTRVIGMIAGTSMLQVASERGYHVARALKERGYDLLKFDLHHVDNVSEIVNHVIEARVDGVVVASTGIEADLAPLLERKVPVVGLAADELPGVSLVRGDMQGGFRQLVDHLLGQGHRTLVQFSHAPTSDVSKWSWRQKLQVEGFRQGLEEAGGTHGVGTPQDYVAWMQAAPEGSPLRGFTVLAGADIMGTVAPFDPYRWSVLLTEQLLAGCEILPDALLCQNDDWAYGAANTLLRAGYSIPGDIAITGFNASTLAETFFVPMTTVQQPIREMSELAVNILLDEIEGEARPRQTHDLPCELVVRESSLRRKPTPGARVITVH